MSPFLPLPLHRGQNLHGFLPPGGGSVVPSWVLADPTCSHLREQGTRASPRRTQAVASGSHRSSPPSSGVGALLGWPTFVPPCLCTVPGLREPSCLLLAQSLSPMAGSRKAQRNRCRSVVGAFRNLVLPSTLGSWERDTVSLGGCEQSPMGLGKPANVCFCPAPRTQWELRVPAWLGCASMAGLCQGPFP